MTETVAQAPRLASKLPDTPYVGLVPYSEADAAFFFGRDAEKRIVTANLRASRLTLVYGPSGVGKTSLLQAGVVHDLREQVVVRAGTLERAPFAIAVFRGWRDEPLPALMESIRASVEEAVGADVEPWRPGESVVETLRGWTRHARTLLVVLDQFEDYFLYHPNEAGEETFDAQLPRIVNDPNLRANFLVSIREDAWAKLDRFEGRIPQLFVNYVRVEYLDREGGTDAAEGPIEEYNRRLPPGEAAYSIEPELVEAVVEAASAGGLVPDEGGVAAAPSGEQVETPFLQLVLERLWRATVEAGGRELAVATLDRLGGPQQIVETHLVDALGRLDPHEQAVAAEAFRYLVTRSRRRVVQSVSDLAEWLGKPEEELLLVLEKLASGDSGRILRPVPPPPGQEGARYELFHDVLAEPVIDWRRQYEREREREAEARHQRAVRRRLALIALGLLVLVVAFAAFAGWALHERAVATKRADVAESQALAARSLRAQSLDPRQSLVLAAQAQDRSATPQAAEALRRSLIAWPEPTVLVPPGRTTYGIDFSPDGGLVATAGGGGAHVWTAAGEPVATLVPKRLVYSARFSNDGRFLVAAVADGAVRIWRVADWRELPGRARILPDLLARAAFTRNGRFLVAGGYPGWPNRVWRVDDGRVGSRVTARDGLGGWIEPDGTARVADARTVASAAKLASESPFTFASSPTGRTSAAADEDGLTPVFRTASRRRLLTLPESAGAVFDPDGLRLATLGGADGSVVWDLETRQPAAILTGAGEAASFSADGRLVASASDEQSTARVWDASSGAVLAELPPRPPRYHSDVELQSPYPVNGGGGGVYGSEQSGSESFGVGPAFELVPSASFSRDGGLVATWGRPRGGAQVWQPFGTRRLGRLGATSFGDGGLAVPTAVSPDGRLVAGAGPGHSIAVWSSADGRRLPTLRGPTDFVSAIAFSPAGDLLAAASFDRAVRVWRVADGTLAHTFRGAKARVGDVAFSPDGTLVASAGEDGKARIWRLQDGTVVRVLAEPTGPLASVSFSADGRSLVAAGGKGTARVWSTDSWKQLGVLGPTRTGEIVLKALLSPDGRFVATLDLDATARLWHAAGGPPIRTLGNVATLAFSPDGSRLLVGGGDATARIVRVTDGMEVGLLRGHTDTVAGIRFNRDGDLIVTAGLDGTARVWQAATEGPVAVVSPGDFGLGDALFAADGRLVTVGDGVGLYACEQCLAPARLRELAAQRLAPR